MAEHAPRYTIYLLTVWFDDVDNASNPTSWRFRLENPRTKEGRGFIGIEALALGLVNTIRQEFSSQSISVPGDPK